MITRSIESTNARHRTVFEATVKIVEQSPGGFCAALTLEDDVHGESVVISSTGLNTYNRKAHQVPLEMQGVWRSIRVDAYQNSFRIFIDGAEQPAIEIPWTRHATHHPRRWIRFGDSSSKGGGRVLYKDVKVSIYETL
jgi:hypothetical protein